MYYYLFVVSLICINVPTRNGGIDFQPLEVVQPERQTRYLTFPFHAVCTSLQLFKKNVYIFFCFKTTTKEWLWGEEQFFTFKCSIMFIFSCCQTPFTQPVK